MEQVKANVGNYNTTYKKWKWKLPEFFNLSELIDRWAEEPRRIALYWLDDKGNTYCMTYEKLKKYSSQFAGVLTSLRIKKGDKAVIILPRLVETHIAYLGIVKTGAVAVPVSQLYAPKAMQYVIDNCDAKYIITSDELRDTMLKKILPKCRKLKKIIIVGKSRGKEVNFWEELHKQPAEFKVVKTKGNDLSTFLYTSGTTGMPKGVMHTHWWLIGNVPQVKYWQDVHENDMVWCTADLTWITGLINAFLGPMSQGAAVLSYNGRFDAARWFDLIEQYGVTSLVTAPTALRLIIARGKELKKRYNMNLRVVGGIGERVNDEIIYWWKKRFKLTVLDGYGQTECMAFICNYPGMKVKIGSCGKPTPGHIVTIRNQNTKKEIIKPNVRGMVAMKRTSSPVLYQGYWKNKAKTRATFKGEWYYTGDAAYKDKDGYIWIEGRDDDVIKTSGYRVGPYEVESTLLEHPAVLESAIVGKPHPILGHILKGLIVLNKGYKPSQALIKELQIYVKTHLAVYKYPKEVVFVKELPKTQSGKIKRKILRIAEEEAYYEKNPKSK